MTTLPMLAPASLTQGGTISTGKTILFAVVAGVTVACGFGLLTAKRAVSAAVNLIGIMIGLAVLYIAGEAPFLGITQVVVYTGAVMTLVLFVVMLVGVGGDEPVSTGSAVTTWIVGVFGLGLVVALVGAVAGSASPAAEGLDSGARATPAQLAVALFGDHVVVMELTGLLLIIAAVGALALTHKAAYREPFEPLPGGVEFIPAGDIEALRTALGPDVAALVVEPIQGEAGVRELPAGYLEAARELTEAAGALLIIDEVQTGMGRTGAWMAHHLLAPGVVPDVVTLAKGLGGGIPIGAAVATGQAAALLEPGQHGTTFGGNPVACAAALAVIETIRSQALLNRVQQLGSAWSRELAAVDGVDQVRGRGLLLGVGMEDGLPPAAELTAALATRGFIVNAPRPDTIRLAPPFILSDDDARAFTTTLSKVLARALSEKAGS